MSFQKFLSLSEVADRTSLSRTTIHRLRVSNSFVTAHRISKGRIAFLESDIDKWITEQSSNSQIAA